MLISRSVSYTHLDVYKRQAAERARLLKELEAAESDVARREGRLANAGFVDKAPAAVVQRERDGLAAIRATLEKLRIQLADLGEQVRG